MKALFKNKIVIIVLAALLILSAIFATWLIFHDKDKSDKIVIYTSFYPLYYFSQKIGGDKVEVKNLLGVGEEAHGLDPSAKQIQDMHSAHLIVINGVGMEEEWIGKLSNSLQEKVLDTSTGLTLINRPTGTKKDPHVWLSLSNAKLQMAAIRDRLVQIDDKNADYYNMNFNKYAELIEGLKSRYDALLTPFAGSTFVVSHGAFGYIAHDYNLVQVSISGIDSEEEPDAQKMKEIIDKINEQSVTTIFYHTFINSKTVQTIKDETPVTKLKVLSTLENLTPQQTAAGDDYLSLMSQNLIELVASFS